MSDLADITPAAALEPARRRLTALARLDPLQAARLDALCRRVETVRPGAAIVKEGQAMTRPRFVAAGWACRQRILSNGRRQIISLVLPGDTVGCSRQSRLLPAAAGTVALTRVVLVDAQPALEQAEGLDGVFELAETRDHALLLNQIVRLGRQTAYERMAHLLLEIGDRLSLAGAGDRARFPLPLTQEALADVLGLSVVHVNRTLQQLRRERLIEFAGGQVTLLDPALLASLADYTPLADGGR